MKNHTDVLIFHHPLKEDWLFVSERKQIALMAEEKIAYAIYLRLFAINRSEMRFFMEEENRGELHKRILTNLLCYAVAILLLIFVVPKLIRFFSPLLIAWIIAAIANPIVCFLEDKIKIMRKHGSVAVIVAVLILVGALLYLAVYFIVAQFVKLSAELPQAYKQFYDSITNALVELHQRFSFIPDNLQTIFGKNNEDIGGLLFSALDSFKEDALSSIASFASSLINTVVLSVLTLMLSYFFVVEREKIKDTVQRCLPKGVKDFWNMAVRTCLRAIGGYLSSCFKIMLVIFIILLVIFGFFLRTDYAWLLALVTAFLDFLPFLGTGIVIAPWAVYCFLTGSYIEAVILVITYVICLIVHRLLEPKLVGDSIGMSSFAILLFMFIGYRLIGMLGLILGIPVGMILVAFKEEGMFDSLIRGIKILAHDINEYRKY